MDLDTASAIDRLSERIDALDTSLRAVIDDRISSLDSSLHTFVGKVEGSLRDEIAELRVELREGFTESRRHATILNESTHEDIRFVAEAVAGLTVKIDSLLR